MFTFLTITLLMFVGAKVQHNHDPRAYVEKAAAGTATQEDKEKFIAWADKVATKAEKRLAKIEAREREKEMKKAIDTAPGNK